ncbi:putative tRNA pseudouridine synthase C25B8.05 [Lachnellula cervina]|uniref:Putative tRNA pseudouridine synthase C25B8.05 n=1 Tax=Lachnellula cervina TaxID=1316786 RepID=A0A7D8YRT1_9HELO|nr:putative tRNA pseudouridine synthase C25B8.05 [Lachnellula cervina]
MSRSNRWRRPKQDPKTTGAKAVHNTMEVQEKMDYSAWSQEKLIERVTQLEQELKNKNQSITTSPPPQKKSWKKPRNERVFDPSKYNTRLVAFKLAYLGKNYNGFEWSPNQITPRTTIEEELWKALNKTRLIFPKNSHPLAPGEVDWEGTEYSKCGRTDKGVSAFGQVIGIRVRSNRPLGKRRGSGRDAEILTEAAGDVLGENENEGIEEQDLFHTLPRENGMEISAPPLAPSKKKYGYEPQNDSLLDPDFTECLNFDPIKDELPYCALLNRLLPPDIRILAWCPFPPADFSARFSCKERQYKYFFTNPCFAPMPDNLEPDGSHKAQGKMKDGWLDIEAMKQAAKLFEGLHDFRNFCKVDPGKQITNFDRRIFYADISEETDRISGAEYVREAGFFPEEKTPGQYSTGPRVYSFNLHGSAFLWHQVRHMVAILFLVGQGLEPLSIVSDLLDAEKNPRRPIYEMASDTPLVLWNCIFPHEDDPLRKDAMQWHYIGDEPGNGDAKYGTDGLMDNLWKVWRGRKVDEMLAAALMSEVHYNNGATAEELIAGKSKLGRSQKVFDGGDEPRLHGTYVPVMKKMLLEDVGTINNKYALRKGFKDAADMKEQGYRKRLYLARKGDEVGESVDELVDQTVCADIA